MNQGARTWYLCYHNIKLPVTTFVHLDDVNESTHDSMRVSNFIEDAPNANSTQIESRIFSHIDSNIRQTSVLNNSIGGSMPRIFSHRSTTTTPGFLTSGNSHDVGHISHIPRVPPSQATFTIPSINNKSINTINDNEDLFGMIKLRDNDVCYTSGTIEWVGRKRTYPINSGFKIMTEQTGDLYQSHQKKVRKLNLSTTGDKFKECDCADVLPTVNAIVDHLNALHEAVDLVDLRLNTLEEVMSRNGS